MDAPYFIQEEPRPALPVGYVDVKSVHPRAIIDTYFSLASLEGEWHEFESKRERARKRRKVDLAAAPDSSGQPPPPPPQ